MKQMGGQRNTSAHTFITADGWVELPVFRKLGQVDALFASCEYLYRLPACLDLERRQGARGTEGTGEDTLTNSFKASPFCLC